MKKIFAGLALLVAAGSVQAATLSTVLYDNAPGQQAYKDWVFGTISADRQVKATFKFVGEDSGWKNGAGSFDAYGATDYIDERGDSVMTAIMNAGVMNFWFWENNQKSTVAVHNSDGRTFTNDGTTDLTPAFLVLSQNLDGSKYILGFNDSDPVDKDFNDYRVEMSLVATPLPAAAWLFGSALVGLGALSRKKLARNKAATVAA